MAEITFTIPNDKLSRVVTAMKGLYPIPTIPDPGWVDPEDGSEAPQIPEFTDNQWAKECTRRFIKRTVARYEQKIAKDAIAYLENDDIAS